MCNIWPVLKMTRECDENNQKAGNQVEIAWLGDLVELCYNPVRALTSLWPCAIYLGSLSHRCLDYKIKILIFATSLKLLWVLNCVFYVKVPITRLPHIWYSEMSAFFPSLQKLGKEYNCKIFSPASKALWSEMWERNKNSETLFCSHKNIFQQ